MKIQILEVSVSNHVDRDHILPTSSQTLGTRHYQTVTLKEALTYVSIGKFSCALYIYGLLHRYLSIYETAESCHANMT